jgi:hypothetical protein
VPHPPGQDVVTLEFRDLLLRFRVVEQTDDILQGVFLWTDSQKARLHEMTVREDEDDWYLDDDGYRLGDAELFERTPWSVVGPTGRFKAVQRFMDWDSGETWFCLTPWVRIGDEYNHPPPK